MGWDGIRRSIDRRFEGGARTLPLGFRGTLLDLDTCCSVVIIGRLSWTSKYNGRLKAWTPWALGRWTDGTLARKERWV